MAPITTAAVAGIESTQSMTYEFNNEKVVKNLCRTVNQKPLRDWLRS